MQILPLDLRWKTSLTSHSLASTEILSSRTIKQITYIVKFKRMGQVDREFERTAYSMRHDQIMEDGTLQVDNNLFNVALYLRLWGVPSAMIANFIATEQPKAGEMLFFSIDSMKRWALSLLEILGECGGTEESSYLFVDLLMLSVESYGVGRETLWHFKKAALAASTLNTMFGANAGLDKIAVVEGVMDLYQLAEDEYTRWQKRCLDLHKDPPEGESLKASRIRDGHKLARLQAPLKMPPEDEKEALRRRIVTIWREHKDRDELSAGESDYEGDDEDSDTENVVMEDVRDSNEISGHGKID